MRLRKPHIVPLLFIVVVFFCQFALGIWQLERLQWKNTLTARIEAQQAQPLLGTLPQEIGGLDYRNVTLTGEFLHDKSIRLAGGQPQGSGPGFFIVTPLRLEDDGRLILINRGYSPKDKESKPEGLQTVEGILRPARAKRAFAPDNQPQQNIWFHEDIAAISKLTGDELIPLVVEAVGKAEKGVYPTPSAGKIALRNDHLGYAITWFALAFIALIMFVIYHREQKSQPPAAKDQL